MLQLYRSLISARRGVSGALTEIESDGVILSYRRGAHRVVLNTGEETVANPFAGAGDIVVSTAATPGSNVALAPGEGLLSRASG
jgi:hypothetical protein